MKAKLVIQMDGNSTTILNPEDNTPKTFAFDFSYWSHDQFEVRDDGVFMATGPRYADQRRVFNDLGGNILEDAFNGYNCSLFAYGQTGSGKSYSMVGYGPNRGIIPITCDELFQRITSNPKPGLEYQVTVSMLEIYNEQVRDLLNPKVNKAGGLKVRSKPGIGNYVEDLTPVPVSSYKQIEEWMEEGTRNRTVAATKMNATSSRAHTVFTITFRQITKKEGSGENQEVSSKINLVDLAGSERADSTGATGDRLKEGSAINQSLSALGNVISALADISMGKKKVFVPYRNSVLTRLLQDALGGNSKTIMIAALSPADVNYDETLSTLRYADRAKKIKNNVTKNENPTDRIIRELKEENARLQKLLGTQGLDPSKALAGEGGAEDEAKTEELKRQLEEQMRENARILEEMQKSWDQKLQEALQQRAAAASEAGGAVSAGSAAAMSLPSIINLHEDSALSECVVYVFRKGLTRIGRADAAEKQDIVLAGLNIQREHAQVMHDDLGNVTVAPCDKAKVFVNGDLLAKPVLLGEGDRVIFGNNFFFRFHNPTRNKSEAKDASAPMDWAQAMAEFTTKQGLRLQQDSMSQLEAEEASRRTALEKRLRDMEAAITEERDRAKKALEQQRKSIERRLKNGEKVSEEELESLRAMEQAFEFKAQHLNDELAKRKEIGGQMVQRQLRRQRELKKLQKDLDGTLPKINEANAIAKEMGRAVTLEVRLSVKEVQAPRDAAGGVDGGGGGGGGEMEELRPSKQINVSVRVSNTKDGSQWNWSLEKFENRLFVLRELYQRFLENGPLNLAQAEDPLWDPPEAIEIGQAYVYLKALSHLVEVEGDFAVVDHKGAEQGSLLVEIQPEALDGGELDYLESSEDIVGQGLRLRLRIRRAQNLPDGLSNDVFVSFSFLDEYCETAACEAKTRNPEWNYEKVFVINAVDERLRRFFLDDALALAVKGFTDAQAQQIAQSGGALAALGGAAAAESKMRVACQQCEEAQAEWECLDCTRCFCRACFDLLHQAARKRDHKRQRLADAAESARSGAASPSPPRVAGEEAAGVTGHLCQQCEEQSARWACQECDRVFCDGCFALLHKSKGKAGHSRMAVEQAMQPPRPQPTATQPPCQQCEEQGAAVKCLECDKVFCGDCNALLHKSAAKREHRRAPLG
jgi:hypothetical protein